MSMTHSGADGLPDSVTGVAGHNQLLTTGEVARLFRVARSTVTSWAYRGLLPYTTTPTGHLRFYRSSIERRLAERRGPGGP
jgi:excisionase family DNA binding protein